MTFPEQNYWQPAYLESLLISVPDFPKPGITFRDITPILETPIAYQSLIHQINKSMQVDFNKLVAIESRGFILGAAIAAIRHVGLVVARKPGKLPREVLKQAYNLEYGDDCLEVHATSLAKGDRVIIIDDVLATGGTAHAVELICERAGAKVLGHRFFIELEALEGRKKLQHPVQSLLKL
jgi:adenine phosphoribosyltransferase